jgi:proline dehydrogenase
MSSDPKISFDNTEIAFRHKSNSELKKTYHLFQMMNIPVLVSIGNTMIGWFLKLNFPIQNIIKKTIFEQFCGGTNLIECSKLITKLKKDQIETLLNYSVEGLKDKQSYKETFERTMQSIEFANEQNAIRAICIKLTGYAKIEIWEKVQAHIALNEDEQEEYNMALLYIDKLCYSATQNDVQLYVDAEESWFQDAIDAIVDNMMKKYNEKEAYIFNTYQLYRSDKLEALQKSIDKARAEGYVLGAKLVRGAYVEKETEYASKNKTQSPIQKNKEATDHDFNKGLELCIKNIDVVSSCCASHNEYSNQYYAQLINQYNIPLNSPRVCSAQLLGMSDNISYNLSSSGLKVCKYVPYGPIKEVIPYLIRRAQENTSIEGQSSREFELLKKEVRRRGL